MCSIDRFQYSAQYPGRVLVRRERGCRMFRESQISRLHPEPLFDDIAPVTLNKPLQLFFHRRPDMRLP